MARTKKRARGKRRKARKRRLLSVAVAAVVVFAIFSVYSYIEIRGLRWTIDQQGDDFLRTQEELDNAKATISGLTENLRANMSELERVREQLEALMPRVINYFAVGVTDDEEGEVIPLRVTLLGEENSISVDVRYLMYGEDIQRSARNAVAAVAFLEDRQSLPVGVQIRVGGASYIVRVDGGSAGAAMAAAIFAALEGKEVDNGVLITGSIGLTGGIGRVDAVAEKAAAARDWGATLFLVPAGQYVEVSGIEVREVASLWEALEHILQ